MDDTITIIVSFLFLLISSDDTTLSTKLTIDKAVKSDKV